MSKYALRRYNCTDCGQPTVRKRKSTQPMVCYECGVKRAETAMDEMYRKQGEAWRRFQESCGPLGLQQKPSRKE